MLKPKTIPSKRHMVHIAHLRNLFKSINTKILIRREKNSSSSIGEFNGPYLWKLDSPSHKDALCQVSLKMAMWFCTRRFLNLAMYFRYFVIISPWKSGAKLIRSLISWIIEIKQLCCCNNLTNAHSWPKYKQGRRILRRWEPFVHLDSYYGHSLSCRRNLCDQLI